MTTTKTCSACRRDLDRNKFGPRAGMRDGLRGQCRECRSKKQRDWVRANADRLLPVYAEQAAAWRRANPEKAAEIDRRCKAKDPRKWKARNKVNHAIAAGTMLRPDSFMCLDCGGAATEYDHYLGYDEAHWLHVQPVCKRCHGKRRRKT